MTGIDRGGDNGGASASTSPPRASAPSSRTESDAIRPEVSVVIPTFDRAWILPTAVGSAAAQSADRIEIIVVDDGSRDETPRVCRDLAAADSRVRVIRQENRGLPAARNAGLAAAVGEWVAFLDDDDLWHPDFLKAMMGHVRGNEREAVACRAATFRAPAGIGAIEVLAGRDEYEVRPWPAEPPPDLMGVRDLIMRPLVPPHGGLFRRATLDRLGGYDETLRSAEDYDVWLRLAAVAPIPVLPEILALIRVHPRQMSHRLATMASNTRLVIERFLAARPETARTMDRQALARRLGRLAREEAYACLLAARRADAFNAALRALRYSPTDLKSMAYLALSPLPGLYSALRRLVRRTTDVEP